MSVGFAVERIAVVGGGRWARIIADTITGLVSADTTVTLYANRDVEDVRSWIGARSGPPIGLHSGLPGRADGLAVIVANAARDHERVLTWALDRRVPVLCEKPLTLSADATAKLIAKAEAAGTPLCAAHVFRYASYLNGFADLVRKGGPIKSVDIVWTDPAVEMRYGIAKTFDSSLPIYADWVPHILSVLQTLIPVDEIELLDVLPTRGGASLRLVMLVTGGIAVNVDLARNSQSRIRTLRVTNDTKAMVLDFAQEPGAISADGISVPADFGWSKENRPLRLMLGSFLTSVRSGHIDPRLSVITAWKSNLLMDQIALRYAELLKDWTLDQLDVCAGAAGPDLRYRLEEVLQVDGRLAAGVLAEKINGLLEAKI